MSRVLKYEFKLAGPRRKLIVWRALERGQKCVLFTADQDKHAPAGELIQRPEVLALTPKPLSSE